MLKNIVWSDPSREHDLPQGWRAHTAPSDRGSQVVQFDMQVMNHGPHELVTLNAAQLLGHGVIL